MRRLLTDTGSDSGLSIQHNSRFITISDLPLTPIVANGHVTTVLGPFWVRREEWLFVYLGQPLVYSIKVLKK